MPDTNTPRVPPEAVKAAVSATRSTEPWCELAISAALPAIHAERDRAWMEALLSDKARRALADMVGSAYDRGSVLTLTLGAVIDAALDSLQVSGGARLDAGDSDQRSTASAAETEAACSPAASVESSGTDKPQSEGEEAVSLPHLISGEFGVSTSEARRLLHQGGVRIDGKVWRALDAPMSHLVGKELQIERRKTRLAQQPDPQDQEGGAAEFTAEQEIADRQIVISFVGGPLSDRAGFARDLRPIQLAEGTYRFLEVGSEGDAVFEWGPTHYVDHSTQPDTSHGDREGELQAAIEEAKALDAEGKLEAVRLESRPENLLRVVWREPGGERRRCSTYIPIPESVSDDFRAALAATPPRFTAYTHDALHGPPKQRRIPRKEYVISPDTSHGDREGADRG